MQHNPYPNAMQGMNPMNFPFIPQQVIHDALAMSAPVEAADEPTLVQAILSSRNKGETYKDALNSLHGVCSSLSDVHVTECDGRKMGIQLACGKIIILNTRIVWMPGLQCVLKLTRKRLRQLQKSPWWLSHPSPRHYWLSSHPRLHLLLNISKKIENVTPGRRLIHPTFQRVVEEHKIVFLHLQPFLTTVYRLRIQKYVFHLRPRDHPVLLGTSCHKAEETNTHRRIEIFSSGLSPGASNLTQA